jgi:hypothetical protein
MQSPKTTRRSLGKAGKWALWLSPREIYLEDYETTFSLPDYDPRFDVYDTSLLSSRALVNLYKSFIQHFSTVRPVGSHTL